MTALLADTEFARPAFLWLALLLPLLWLGARQRGLPVLIARTLILALVIVTLADPQSATQQSRSQERIFAFDISDSIPPSVREWMKNSRNGLASPGSSDRVFVFGAATAEVTDWIARLDGEGAPAAGVRPEKTSLESVLQAALALPPAPRDLYLFSDGWETEGDIERLLPAAAAAGIRIHPIVPAGRPAIPNVAVTKLLAPSQGGAGESLNLKVVVENQSERPVDGSLTLARNGQTFKTEAVRVNPGSQVFSFQTVPAEGLLTSFQATFNPRAKNLDHYPADNRALAWVSVRAKNKILLINGQRSGRYLEEILKRQGLDVAVRAPGNAPAPAGYKVIVFNNAEREKFAPAYLSAVEKHTAAGNGFVMLGADASFAPDSYRQTPIERVLPVEPREPPKREEKNRAIVLVIDKSGSMRDDNRILYAKEAAKAVARQLRDIDLLGVVGFDDAPFVVVYLETLARLRGVVETQIDRLKPGGQTYFLPALIEARRQLERANATRKHLILLSDGVTRGSQGELVDLVSSMRNDSKITVSAVAISTEADVRIMKRLSQYGGGLFHHTVDPSSLPQVVLEQLQDAPKEDPQKEGPWSPIPDRNSELLAGLGIRAYPSVLGFMDTDLKRGARMDLAVQRQDRRLPLLASWRYGQGKAIALTMDLEGRWSRNWIPWSGLQNFWNRLLEWLAPPEENLIPAHEARVNVSENRSILDLSVYEEAGANSQYRFSMSGKSKAEGALTRLAPGHFRAILPANEPGDYRIDISEDRGGRRIAFPPVGYSLPYPLNSEMPRPDFNMRLLAHVAEATGGAINPVSSQTQAQVSTSKNYTPLKQPLIILAFCLFLAEVALRKFAYAEPD